MNNPSISNPPTSFPTDAMIEAARQASDWVADLRDDEITHIYLAMHKASPQLQSTEVVERVAMALFEHEWSTTFNSPPKWGFDGSEAYWREAARAAITTLTSPAVVEDLHADETFDPFSSGTGQELLARAAHADEVERLVEKAEAALQEINGGRIHSRIRQSSIDALGDLIDAAKGRAALLVTDKTDLSKQDKLDG